MKELGHAGKTIDIFKIDCERCEVETYAPWLAAPMRLQQILVKICSNCSWKGQMKLLSTINMFQARDYEDLSSHTRSPTTVLSEWPLPVILLFVTITWNLEWLSQDHRHDDSESAIADNAVKRLDAPKPFIKMTQGADNASWKLIDWINPFSPEEESEFNCKWTMFQSVASGKQAHMCMYSFHDVISSIIKRFKRRGDCNQLLDLWATNNRDDDESLYMEIGANIGSCIMEMLLETNAAVIVLKTASHEPLQPQTYCVETW